MFLFPGRRVAKVIIVAYYSKYGKYDKENEKLYTNLPGGGWPDCDRDYFSSSNARRGGRSAILNRDLQFHIRSNGIPGASRTHTDSCSDRRWKSSKSIIQMVLQAPWRRSILNQAGSIEGRRQGSPIGEI
jgi:hypothetical protein